MIALNANAIKLSLARLQSTRKTVVKRGDAGFRQKLYYLYGLGVVVSPQFSGEFASNWNIVVDGNMPVFKPWPGKHAVEHDGQKLMPHKAGDPEAVATAMARGAAQLRGVTMKSQVHFVNATELFTDGTRMIGPDGVEQLRPENIIPGRVRIESYLRARARELGSTA
jgi:hypothetical protein